MLNSISIGKSYIPIIDGIHNYEYDEEYGSFATNFLADKLYTYFDQIINGVRTYFYNNEVISINEHHYSLYIILERGNIVEEILKNTKGEEICTISLGDKLIGFTNELMECEWFNLDSIIDCDPPNKPWLKSILLGGLELKTHLFKYEEKAKEGVFKNPDKVIKTLVAFDMMDENLSLDWVIHKGGSGARYLAFLIDNLLEVKPGETFISCDPYIGNLHILVKRKLWKILGDNYKDSQLVFFGEPDIPRKIIIK